MAKKLQVLSVNKKLQEQTSPTTIMLHYTVKPQKKTEECRAQTNAIPIGIIYYPECFG